MTPINDIRQIIIKQGYIGVIYYKLDDPEYKKALQKLLRIKEIKRVIPLNMPNARGWDQYVSTSQKWGPWRERKNNDQKRHNQL